MRLYFLVLIVLINFSKGITQNRAQLPVQETLDSWDTMKINALIAQLQDGPMRDSLAYSYHILGVVYYYEHENYPKAIEATRTAISVRTILWNEKPDTVSAFDLGKSLYNLGSFYRELKAHDKAEDLLQKAIPLFDKSDTYMAVESRRLLGFLLTEKGDFDQAFDHFNVAIRMAEEADLQAILADCRIDLGGAFIEKKDFPSAIRSLSKAQAYYESLSDRDIDEDYNLASIYNNIGLAFAKSEDYEKAISFYSKARSINQRWSFTEELIYNYINIGIAERHLQRYSEAIRALTTGSRLTNGSEWLSLQSKCYDNLADVFLDQGETERALEYYHRAIQGLISGYGNTDFRHNPPDSLLEGVTNKTDLVVYFQDKAAGWRKMYEQSGNKAYLQQALTQFRKAEMVLSLMRFEHQNRGSLLFWREDSRGLYESALATCLLLEDPASAFYFFEKSKSVLLLDAILSLRANTFIDEQTVAEEQALQEHIVRLRAALESAEDAKQRDSLLRVKLQVQADYADFREKLAKENDRYYQLRYGLEVLSLSQLQAQLPNDTTYLLHYFFGKEQIYLMRVGKSSVLLDQIESPASKTTQISNLLAFFKEDSKVLDQPEQYFELSQQLYESLYAVAWSDGVSPFGKCTILPDGPLHYLPFEALLTTKPKNYQLGQQAYLMNQQEIHYGYSATILAQQAALSGPKTEGLFVAAPFLNRSTSAYEQLSYSKGVYDYLRNRFRGTALADENASVAALQSTAPAYRVLHLSTHASANPQNQEPFIVFADTLLYLNALYGMRLPADLVVLSACETGLGDLAAGEGVSSLAQGFAYAGTKAMIASLWKVNDFATAYIFEHFYKNLNKGYSAAAALALAKNTYRMDREIPNRYRSPYFWAGFILIGNDVPVDLPERRGQWWWWGIGVLVFIGSAWLFYRRL